MKLTIFMFGGILFLSSCNGDSSHTVNETPFIDGADSLGSSKELIDEEVEEITTIDSLSMYLDNLDAYASASVLQGVQLDYYTIKEGNDKHNFQYLNNWFSIDVNEEGKTYTGIYKVNNGDTLLQYVSIIPEIEMEGVRFINYDSEPGMVYNFEANWLERTEYFDPENDKAVNPMNQFEERELNVFGDSIHRLMRDFFYLDTSSARFRGVWAYSENSEEYIFDLDLKQVGSFVSGSYCAYTANRVDCGVMQQGGDPCFVNGYVYADTLHLEYLSCYAGKRGTAELYFKEDTLVWNSKYKPEGSLVPQTVSLIRKE